MRIRKMKEGDITGIVKIIHKIMGPKDAKKALYDVRETLMDKPYSPFKFEDFYVAEIDGHIVAAGGVWALNHDPYIARLDWFVVDPGQQRKGIGTMLMRHIENFLRKQKIRIVLAETSSGRQYKAAISFWSKNGFKNIAKIPNYWEDGSACLYFLKRL